MKNRMAWCRFEVMHQAPVLCPRIYSLVVNRKTGEPGNLAMRSNAPMMDNDEERISVYYNCL